ncbi:MAG: ABC transporter ATP-binding protein [Thermosphaera sp.]
MTYLKLQDISKVINNKTVLQDVNVEINKGEVVAVTGFPGSGKTTLLKIIGGLLSPTKGRIYLEGRDITDLPPHERGFSMVFEIPPIYPDRTGYENIAFPLRLRKLSENEIRSKVMSVAELLGIKHILERKPSTYSGGEYQRVALARALVTEPKLLLLDEPFKSLDAKIREAMVAWIKDLHKRIGVTIVYSTHDPLEAMSVGNRVLVLLKGVQKQFAPPLDILTKPIDLDVDEFTSIPALNVLKGRFERCEENRVEIVFNKVKLNLPRKIMKCEPGLEVLIAFRPQDAKLTTVETAGSIIGRVSTINYMGRNQLISLETDGIAFRAIADKELKVKIGETVYLTLNPDRIRLYDPASRRVLE